MTKLACRDSTVWPRSARRARGPQPRHRRGRPPLEPLAGRQALAQPRPRGTGTTASSSRGQRPLNLWAALRPAPFAQLRAKREDLSTDFHLRGQVSEAHCTALVLRCGWELFLCWEESGRSPPPGRCITCWTLVDGDPMTAAVAEVNEILDDWEDEPELLAYVAGCCGRARTRLSVAHCEERSCPYPPDAARGDTQLHGGGCGVAGGGDDAVCIGGGGCLWRGGPGKSP